MPIFPPVDSADEYGLLAVGGSFSPALLIEAYSQGIFPWPHPDLDDIPWFSPPERGVLFLDQIKGTRRSHQYARSIGATFCFDRKFKKVMQECRQAKRKEGESSISWITDEMIEGYTELHQMGIAHSAEVYVDDELVGGVYGICLGKMFAAESMFHTRSNTSTIALVGLCEHLKEQGASWLDCQELNPHTKRLGARRVPRKDFLVLLNDAISQEPILFPK